MRPEPPAPFRAEQETELERLKAQLLQKSLYVAPEPRYTSYLRRAANEAAALAWVTQFPLLVFPGLFEEKAEAALVQAARQESVRARSRDLMIV